jgi:hypothetical protein
MFPSQSNTQSGTRQYNSGEALTSMEGRLVKVVDGGSIPELKLPEAVSDICLHVVVDGNGEDEQSQVIPLEVGKEVRVRANGTGSAGDVLVLEAISGANIGKVRSVPTTEGVYFSPGKAVEDFVDEQLVKIDPMPRLVFVGAAFTSATPAATAATNSSPYGFTQAQADAILTNVREMRAFMVAQGWKATS